MMMACGVFGYTMNTMGDMLSQVEQQSSENKEEMKQIDQYMKQKQISIKMQMKVRKYIEYVQESRSKNMINEADLMNQLGTQLKRELTIEINGRVIAQSSILTSNFSERLLYYVALILKEQIISPEETIFLQHQNAFEEKCIYFISEGEVEIFFDRTKTVIQKLGKNHIFGEIGFFTDFRVSSARSADFTNFFYIRRNDFLQVLEKYPGDHVTLLPLIPLGEVPPRQGPARLLPEVLHPPHQVLRLRRRRPRRRNLSPPQHRRRQADHAPGVPSNPPHPPS